MGRAVPKPVCSVFIAISSYAASFGSPAGILGRQDAKKAHKGPLSAGGYANLITFAAKDAQQG